MEAARTVDNSKSGGALRTILTAWLIAGTLDITAASVYYPTVFHFRLILLYQNIASGVLGESAFTGGVGTAALGLLFHFFIALCWTIFFYLVFPKIKIMSKDKFLTGMGYGVFVWLVMNLAVVPLSRVERGPFTAVGIVVSALFLIFCIGLPLSLIIGRHFSAQNRA